MSNLWTKLNIIIISILLTNTFSLLANLQAKQEEDHHKNKAAFLLVLSKLTTDSISLNLYEA